jgi:DNA-directed RNA polymerase sigma subunit (sigma70/sigma32)
MKGNATKSYNITKEEVLKSYKFFPQVRLKTRSRIIEVLLYRSKGITLKQIAIWFNKTPERIRQMESVGIEYIRQTREKYGR